MTDTNNTDGAALLPVTQDEERCEICCRPREQHVGSDLQCNETTYFRPMPAQSHSLPGDVGMREALERIRARASEWTPPEGLEARIAWIEAELDDEPNRPLYGNGDVPCCRTGHEVSELIAEHAGLVARAALTPSPIPATQEDAERSVVGVIEPQYLIRKNGAYYRPKAAGYTTCIAEAGRYSLAEAIKHSHPNGPNGPRDGITYEPAPATPQRQEYDGEAVREALKEAYTQGWQDKTRGKGSRRDAAVDTGMESISAALAHPAQARDEMREREPKRAYTQGYDDGVEDALTHGDTPHKDSRTEGWVNFRTALSSGGPK